jgi:hypothetical protein
MTTMIIMWESPPLRFSLHVSKYTRPTVVRNFWRPISYHF